MSSTGFTGDMSAMSSNPLSAAIVTHACASNDTGMCWGYVDPITNGDGKPCQHVSHENGSGNPRNYGNALNAAREIADMMTETREQQPRGGTPRDSR